VRSGFRAAAGDRIVRLKEVRIMGRLEGKVAFITGSGSGIARAAARLFALEGASIAVAELKPELGRACEATVRDSGGDAAFVETDVTKEESVRSAIQQTVSRFGKLDIVVRKNSTTVMQRGPEGCTRGEVHSGQSVPQRGLIDQNDASDVAPAREDSAVDRAGRAPKKNAVGLDCNAPAKSTEF
jgi:hypothetical protein